MPAERQAETRTAYIKRLHTAILKDEFHVSRGAERQMALLKARLSGADILDTQWDEIIKSALGVEDAPDLTRERFETYYTRVKPVGPPTTNIANWVSRSAAIFARMIDDLPTAGTLSVAGKRIAGPLRASSALTARLTHFALPGSYPRLFAINLLLLAVLIGLVLIIVAAFTNLEAWVGYTVLVASAALWMLLYATGRVAASPDAAVGLRREPGGGRLRPVGDLRCDNPLPARGALLMARPCARSPSPWLRTVSNTEATVPTNMNHLIFR